jgi:hypothetical protein
MRLPHLSTTLKGIQGRSAVYFTEWKSILEGLKKKLVDRPKIHVNLSYVYEHVNEDVSICPMFMNM